MVNDAYSSTWSSRMVLQVVLLEEEGALLERGSVRCELSDTASGSV
jgi:hypothetical protein